jgi:hypothetical protein
VADHFECPQCGGEVRWDFACHTYPGPTGGFFACLPCDSATEYYCVSCPWSYTQGLNPHSPRTAANETHRPQWLPEVGPHEGGAYPPGAAWVSEEADATQPQQDTV